jgi:hypothetical protein
MSPTPHHLSPDSAAPQVYLNGALNVEAKIVSAIQNVSDADGIGIPARIPTHSGSVGGHRELTSGGLPAAGTAFEQGTHVQPASRACPELSTAVLSFRPLSQTVTNSDAANTGFVAGSGPCRARDAAAHFTPFQSRQAGNTGGPMSFVDVTNPARNAERESLVGSVAGAVAGALADAQESYVLGGIDEAVIAELHEVALEVLDLLKLGDRAADAVWFGLTLAAELHAEGAWPAPAWELRQFEGEWAITRLTDPEDGSEGVSRIEALRLTFRWAAQRARGGR